jgi:hypothetical protein
MRWVRLHTQQRMVRSPAALRDDGHPHPRFSCRAWIVHAVVEPAQLRGTVVVPRWVSLKSLLTGGKSPMTGRHLRQAACRSSQRAVAVGQSYSPMVNRSCSLGPLRASRAPTH